MSRRKLSLIACVLLVTISSVSAESRQWTSDDGKFKVEAELVSFDGQVVKLKKLDGTMIDVPFARLSTADREFLAMGKDKEQPAARIEPMKAGAARRNAKEPSAAVVKFQKSMESMRDVEAKRLEKRIANLQKELLEGKNELRQPVARDAQALEKLLNQRLVLVKSGQPFLPRLSPKDFAVGQIGEFDDDIILEMTNPGKDEARISVVFAELRVLGGSPAIWSRGLVYRPDYFHLRSPIVAPLVNAERGGDSNSPTNRLLKKHVFEVVERARPTRNSDYVLVPFKMDEVTAWLREEAKRRRR